MNFMYGQRRWTQYETKDECLEHGGHCWQSDNIVLTSMPPQYPESCKHCPARRIGTPREAMEYREV